MCPSGWTQYTPPNDVPYCYFLSTKNLYETEAAASCQAMGATLVSIHSTDENDFVFSKPMFTENFRKITFRSFEGKYNLDRSS